MLMTKDSLIDTISSSSTYAMFAASVQEGVQLISTFNALLLGGESGGLKGSGECKLVALGRASVGSVAAENGALERRLVVHPPEGCARRQVGGHVAHIVQVANVSLHESAADHEKAN